jgi:PKHD-type hydroxylase
MSYPYPFNRNQRDKQIDYINYYYFEEAFTPEEIQEIIQMGENQELYNGMIGGGDNTENLEYRRSKIAFLEPTEETQWVFDRLAEYAILANENMWNFDLTDFADDIQYTTYLGDQAGHYDWHTDVGESVCNRKLSMVLQLSTDEEYEGGNVQLNVGHTVMNFGKDIGGLYIFPSFVLHRVTPVVSGVRRSLVAWITGPNLK